MKILTCIFAFCALAATLPAQGKYDGGSGNGFAHVALPGVPLAIARPMPVYSVYPNPSKGPIRLGGNLADGTLVEVTDLCGRKVAVMPLAGGTLDLGAVPAGTYLIRPQAATAWTKVVKQ